MAEVFKIGSIVEVINYGKTYVSYYEKFKELGMNNPEQEHAPFQNGTLCRIIGVGVHWRYNEKLVAIEDASRNQSLISESGVQMAEKPEKEKYGYVFGGLYEESGWSVEGGEKAYYEALEEWNKLHQ